MAQHTILRRRIWLGAIGATSALTLAACSASGGENNASPTEAANGFSFFFPAATDSDDFYEKLAQKYMDETGAQIELVPSPADTYNQLLSTQIQAGNATDLFVATPGGGQSNGVVRLANAQLLEPLSEASAAVIPEGTEGLYSVDGKIYGQPQALSANGLVWNAALAADAGIDEFPTDFDALLSACRDARDAGLTFTVLAGSIPANLGLMGQAIAATRVYAADPDWNEQRAAGDVTFADSAWKEVLEDFVSMNEAGCFQDGAAGGTFDAITGSLVQGTALSAPIPGSAAAILSGASQGKYSFDVRAFPPARGEQQWVIASPLYAWAANAKSDPDVKLAVQNFLDWAAQPENLAEFATNSGAIPLGGSDTSDSSPQFAPVSTLVADGSFSAEPNLSWPNASVYDALGSGMQGLLTGQVDVDAVLTSVDAAWGQ